MDKYLVSLALILLSLEVGWLLQDLNLVDVPGLFSESKITPDKPIGAVQETKRQVRRKPSRSFIWEQAATDENVYAFDSVLTLEQSAAHIKLNSGTEIELHENTLITLEPSSPDDISGTVRLRFRKGNLGGKLSSGQKVSAGDWLVEADGNANLSLRGGNDGQFQIENRSGNIKIISARNPAQVVELNSGQSIDVNNQGLTQINDNLKLDWKSPPDGVRFYSHQEPFSVPFQWDGRITEIQIYDSKSAKPQITTIQPPENQKEVRLSYGSYTVRLANELSPTFARNFAIWQAPKIYILNPLPRHRVKRNSEFKLRWTKTKDVARYVYEVSPDPHFNSVIQKGETENLEADLENLPLGEYYFRVKGLDQQGFEIPALYINKFFVIDQPLAPPKLKSPVIKRDQSQSWFRKIWELVLPSARAQDSGYFAEFVWEPVEGADGYLIEISASPDFQNLVVDQSVSTPTFRWPNFQKGKYYWRVAGKAGPAVGLYSEVAYTDLTEIPKRPITPQAAPVQAAKTRPTPLKAKAVESAQKPLPQPKPKLHIHETPFVPWTYQIEFGGYGVFQHFRGDDYTARQVGFAPGVLRFTESADPTRESWRWEAEISRRVVRPKSAQQLPFQDPAIMYGGRLTFINESPNVDSWSWGATIHNQQITYKRSGLETLETQALPWVGGHLSQRNYSSRDETELRFSGFAGVGVYGQMQVIQTWILYQSLHHSLILTVDASINSGYALTKAWWVQGQGEFFFGLRW
ncbi:MAG: hypothetical protein IT289_02760 [Oligoflexia bacterium]|nr:hypothetical protein [Oligoflexia bacterium]